MFTNYIAGAFQQNWEKLKTARSPSGGRVLIYANYGGLETYDVAFYEGKREDGSDWWIMSNVEIPTNRILFWAFINETSND